jgi:hypothetical protein
MAQREVSILDKAVEEVANVAYFIEGKVFRPELRSLSIPHFYSLKNLGSLL